MNTTQFIAVVETSEGTGASHPAHRYAMGRGVCFSRSPKKAMAGAWKKAYKSLADEWDAQDNPYGGCPVLLGVALYKGGKLIHAPEDYAPKA